MKLDFKKNIGTIGRSVRALTGIILLLLIFTETITGEWAIIGYIFAFVLFLESIFSYCFIVDLLNNPPVE